MDSVLVDSIVRQTTVSIAALATSAGNRASLAHVANEALASLVKELKAQGLGNKVIADMFGLALRTYYDRVARLGESERENGRSLWDAVLAFLQQCGPVLRADVLLHFRRDDEAMVRGVLRDLVRSGLAFESGQGDSLKYRAATPQEHGVGGPIDADAAAANMVLGRAGPRHRRRVRRHRLPDLRRPLTGESDRPLRRAQRKGTWYSNRCSVRPPRLRSARSHAMWPPSASAILRLGRLSRSTG